MAKFYKSACGSPEVIQISNDAYFFLKYGETCLDLENIEEVDELKETYKYGFTITTSGENLVFVEDSDLVEITIIPNILVEINETYTHYFDLFDGWRVEYRYIDNNSKIKMRYLNVKTGKSSAEDEICNVVTNKAKKPEFHTKSGSIFPLWSNNKTHIIKTH